MQPSKESLHLLDWPFFLCLLFLFFLFWDQFLPTLRQDFQMKFPSLVLLDAGLSDSRISLPATNQGK